MPCSPNTTPPLLDTPFAACSRGSMDHKSVTVGSSLEHAHVYSENIEVVYNDIASIIHSSPERFQHQANIPFLVADMCRDEVTFTEEMDALSSCVQALLPWRNSRETTEEPVLSTMTEINASLSPPTHSTVLPKSFCRQFATQPSSSKMHIGAGDDYYATDIVTHHLEADYAHHTHLLRPSVHHYHHFSSNHSGNQRSQMNHVNDKSQHRLTSDGGDDQTSTISENSAAEAHLATNYPHHHHHYHYHHHHSFQSDLLPRPIQHIVVNNPVIGDERLISLNLHDGCRRCQPDVSSKAFKSVFGANEEGHLKYHRDQPPSSEAADRLIDSRVSKGEENDLSDRMQEAWRGLQARVLLWLDDVQSATITDGSTERETSPSVM